VLPVASPEHSLQLTSIVVIPARYESTRFPGKALALLAGRPMIEHVYLRSTRARGISRVLVATDDERIARAVEQFGGEALMTSAAHLTGTDRLAEAATHLECDIIVNVQGDEPLVDPSMIERAIAPFPGDPDLQMTSLRARIRTLDELRDPHVVKVVVDRDEFALYFSRAPIPFDRDSTAGPAEAWRHVGLYAYRRSFLPRFAEMEPSSLEQTERLEQLRALEHGIRIKVLETRHHSVGVDTPADLARVEAIFAAEVNGQRMVHRS
jgi:3-deoxy-manno-octulosonate cytidylyltransferase (CMP-KDO synthetase)